MCLIGILAGCDEGVEVTREFPSTLSQAAYLKGLPAVVPVYLDAVPPAVEDQVRPLLQNIAAELSAGSPVRFAYGQVPDGRDFALRITVQPGSGLTALTLCQGNSIGRLDAPQRSLVVIAAVCDNRRRLGEVRAVRSPQAGGTAGSDGVPDAEVIDAAVRKLFALPLKD